MTWSTTWWWLRKKKFFAAPKNILKFRLKWFQTFFGEDERINLLIGVELDFSIQKGKTGIEFLKTSQTIIPISGEKSTSKVQPIWIFLPCEEISSILASVNFSFETKFDEKLI